MLVKEKGDFILIFHNIQAKCRERNISIRELEASCGIGTGTIYKWQTSAPSVDKVKLVADHFNCTIDELLTE